MRNGPKASTIWIIASLFSALLVSRVQHPFRIKDQPHPSLVALRFMVEKICESTTNWSSSTEGYSVHNLNLAEPLYLRIADLSMQDMRRLATSAEDRSLATISASKVTSETVLRHSPLSLAEHAVAIAMLTFGVPNCVVSIPVVTFLAGKYILGNVALAFQALGIVALPLALWPLDFVPSRLQTWPAQVLFRYFSMSMIMEERPPTHCVGNGTEKDPPQGQQHRPTIVAAYPHGVFPYGSMLTVMSWPLLTGHYMRGIAASAALRTPIVRQCLEALATVHASRASARAVLETWPYTLGVSPGGVAEVFLVNEDQPTILLKERLGIIKLAIRTGADIVPAYMFGNTELYQCWIGEGVPGLKRLLEWCSRRVVGFATVVMWGRWLLPIPYRIPLLTVLGRPIPTNHLKCEEPTLEQMLEIQQQLEVSIAEVFNRYKHLYNLKDKKLVIR